jgi:hypothetical protein
LRTGVEGNFLFVPQEFGDKYVHPIQIPKRRHTPNIASRKQVPDSALCSHCGNGISGTCPNQKPCQSTTAGRDKRCVVGLIRGRSGKPNPEPITVRRFAEESRFRLATLLLLHSNYRVQTAQVNGRSRTSFYRKSSELARIGFNRRRRSR